MFPRISKYGMSKWWNKCCREVKDDLKKEQGMKRRRNDNKRYTIAKILCRKRNLLEISHRCEVTAWRHDLLTNQQPPFTFQQRRGWAMANFLSVFWLYWLIPSKPSVKNYDREITITNFSATSFFFALKPLRTTSEIYAFRGNIPGTSFPKSFLCILDLWLDKFNMFSKYPQTHYIFFRFIPKI